MSDIKLSEKAQQIMDLVKELTVVELADLVKALEEEFGVSAAAAAPVVMAGWAGWEAGWEWGGDDKVNVELTEIGQQKIAVIKTLKAELWIWLKDAKALVEKAPVVVKEKVNPDEAEGLKAKLEEAGATVTLK